MFRTWLASSVKARVALFTLAIFLASMVGMAVHVSTLLRADLQALLTAQQYSTASRIAQEIGEHLLERMNSLEQVARMGGADVMESDVKAQRMLGALPVFQSLFNGGTFITDLTGTAIASEPLSAQRVGLNYGDRDYIQQVLRSGQPAIGQPTVGRALGTPVVVLAVPIRDAGGQVVGALAGVTNLNRQSFLDDIEDNPLGHSGDYLLVSTQHRMIITSSDKQRVMEVLPPPGTNVTIDRFIGGFEGTTTFVNHLGNRVLASVKRVRGAPWYVAVALPTNLAFAPVDTLQRRMLLSIGLLTVLAVAASWWMIRRQLSPLEEAARSLASVNPASLSPEELQPLPVARRDEIGQLILSFNALVSELARQRHELERSELLYSTAFKTSPDAFSITRLDDGRYLSINESFTRIFGWTPEAVLNRSSLDLGTWHRPSDRMTLVAALRKHGRCENLETEFTASDGRLVAVQISATLIEFEGATCMLAVTHDISGRKAAQAQIQRLAFSDPLTSLPNRRLFMDRLDQAVQECARHGRRGALYFIDLDDFKSLNDNLGHDKGDLLLHMTGQQLQALVAPGDTVARLGGDEFVVLVKDLPADAALAAVQSRVLGERILQVLGQPIHIEGQEHHGSASLGLTTFGPDKPSTSDLIRQADLAMYQAKSQGRGRLCVFTPQMQASLSSRTETEAALREAIKGGQLRVYYQPQVGQGGGVFGAEALVRWQHPARGMIAPGEFIPLAERCGLIVPLGHWILERACEQLATWAHEPALAGLTVGVNVSSTQFQQPDFVDQVLQTLERSGADPRRLKLELTESLLVDNIEDVSGKMKQLRRHGVCFSLDDFGTGFSSLAYLKSLPLDELKIDQSFVRDIDADLNDLAIARTIVALGTSLGLAVTAEGVENEAQRQALAGIGCQRCQGYLFGRPAPIEEFEARLRARPALESA